MELNVFKILHSELIAFFQCIEHDLKIIYAYMHEGNPNETLRSLSKTNLGAIIMELELLDNSDNHPYFSKEEYAYLKQIKNIRTYWCHEAYLDFIYDSDRLNSKAYKNVAIQLQIDHDHLNNVYQNVNNVLNTVMVKFRR